MPGVIVKDSCFAGGQICQYDNPVDDDSRQPGICDDRGDEHPWDVCHHLGRFFKQADCEPDAVAQCQRKEKYNGGHHDRKNEQGQEQVLVSLVCVQQDTARGPL